MQEYILRRRTKVHINVRGEAKRRGKRWCGSEVEVVIGRVHPKISVGWRDTKVRLSPPKLKRVGLIDSQGVGQSTDGKTSLLLVEFILVTRACKGLLIAWLTGEEGVIGIPQ